MPFLCAAFSVADSFLPCASEIFDRTPGCRDADRSFRNEAWITQVGYGSGTIFLVYIKFGHQVIW
jgi:hypothetical protein